MARDRRRAKQRRERQNRSARPSANAEGNSALPEENTLHQQEPAELASGEVDLADAQLAVGRPELASADAAGAAEPSLGGSTADELIESAIDDDGESLDTDRGGGRGGDGGAVVARGGDRTPEPKRREGGRFINFLRGSWRELQRVQWPDRTQVAQATAVVIGFVAIAGAFLGAADWISSRIVDLIV
ncbi:preprotein translocase subunit SecE [Conexibacter arvalis]|uniref:Protein translocase subunit SecE n=1 Tax=Conexibacter arvalis TaxID=912552 RepID=A0A840IDS7_9ACTN|nr:preprotein translocase SecE subunit [Conexibacter arvalis]